jgi:hypothetical protein
MVPFVPGYPQQKRVCELAFVKPLDEEIGAPRWYITYNIIMNQFWTLAASREGRSSIKSDHR